MTHEAQNKILAAMLKQSQTEGWTAKALNAAADASGFTEHDLQQSFHRGVNQVFEHWNEKLDKHMLDELAHSEFHSLKIKEKVASALMLRFKLLGIDKAAARSASLCGWNLPLLSAWCRSFWKTADAIWQACEDKSTGFDFYSKRTMLALVAAFSFRAWLADTTSDISSTKYAVDKYIQKVMQIQIAKWKTKQFFARLSLRSKG